MNDHGEYPENRLDIRVDENGSVSYEENAEFAEYYTSTTEELEEELEELEYQRDMLSLDEPDDITGIEHDEWEEEISKLEEQIQDIEEMIRDKL